MATPITTDEEAPAAVRQDGWALQFVPDELMTAELCLEAVMSMIELVFGDMPEPIQAKVRAALKNAL